MLQYILTKEAFLGYTLPQNPTNLDRKIQKIFDASSHPVRLSQKMSIELIYHYIKDKTSEELWDIAHDIIYKPGPHVEWVITSNNLLDVTRKVLIYLGSGEEDKDIVLEENNVIIPVGRFHSSTQWKIYTLFFSINLLNRVLSDEYELEVKIPEELIPILPILRSSHKDISIKVTDSLPIVTVSANNILYRPLKTSNPELEAKMQPNFRLALLTEMDQLLEAAKQVIAENIQDADFNLADLAKLLCVGSRTVQRKLRAEGTTFKQLKSEARTKFITEQLSKGKTSETFKVMAGINKFSPSYSAITKK